MTDQDFMRRAIELARRGVGWTNPNPLVGAVIVKDGRIIGEGWHAKYGGFHAERSALASLRESAEGATMYVTLEPCCHYGRQPPCTQAILESGIARVFVGSRDPNPLVAGKGVQILREHGVQVTEDFLREECDRLNPVFFHYITTKTPYVVMKYAMTADGKIATRTGASKWITGEPARQKVQELRATYSGIMAGIGTVLADDPLLNVRLEGKRSPVRIICDNRLRIPLDSRICATAGQYKTIVACGGSPDPAKQAALEKLGMQVLPCPADDGKINLPALMGALGAMGIDSVLLEGGGTLNESALRAGIVREVKAFVAPKLFGGGGKSPVEGTGVALPDQAWQLELAEVTQIGDDLLLDYRVKEDRGCLRD
ncbi:MAG: bifunctional diaminohydroxyphosphoribosylaminopyrimidine deaminase/5-amino-6-(5-phosphoribosylamino)uracil reductase RibD [Clostridiales bacterium]|nr:bifunctional diaminohydroxyphosphoribosylaminopyrimidine deaminase/5-amino-6-(5-phosphoribosylamino)uracil reductase RibD [Clostridiales bacterium]